MVLQEARHDADYNLLKRYTRSEAESLVEPASEAFEDWRTIYKGDDARLYLTCLLLWERLDKIK